MMETPRHATLLDQLGAWYAQQLQGRDPPPAEGPFLYPCPIVVPPP